MSTLNKLLIVCGCNALLFVFVHKIFYTPKFESVAADYNKTLTELHVAKILPVINQSPGVLNKQTTDDFSLSIKNNVTAVNMLLESNSIDQMNQLVAKLNKLPTVKNSYISQELDSESKSYRLTVHFNEINYK